MIIRKWWCILLMAICSTSFAMENAFYMLRDDSALPNLEDNYKKIHVLISQAYKIDEKGIVTGFVNPNTMEIARARDMKMFVLVTNVGFNREKAHRFLSSTRAQKRAIQAILAECIENKFYGVQFDFEGVSQRDRAALTSFYQHAAAILHEYNFKVSFAVIAIADGESDFMQKQYQLWSGAYDYEELGKIGDFISVMAYDQHSQGTTPGPTASLRWVESTIQYALRFVPAHKLSLGIPVYSGYWYTGNHQGKIKVRLNEMTYEELKDLISKRKIKLAWDDTNKFHYAFHEHKWLNTYIFVEDVHSFKAKLRLAKKYGLRGVSVFNLGSEDKKIWNLLAAE